MNYIFQGISEKNQKKLFKELYASTLHFQKNRSVLSMYKDENIIGIIKHGHIKIIEYLENGSEILIEELEDGNFFSTNFSLFDQVNSDIIPLEDSEIIIIDYNEILENNSEKQYYNIFIKNLLFLLSQKLKEKNERIKILSKKTIRDKLLEYFDLMYKKNHSINLYLPYTFQTLSSYISADRSAMSRELKSLKDEGFIKINGKKITLSYKEKIVK